MQRHADSRKQSTTEHAVDGAAPPTGWTLAKRSPPFQNQPQRKAADSEQVPAHKDDSCTFLTDDNAAAHGHALAQTPGMAQLTDPVTAAPPARNGSDGGRQLRNQALRSTQPSSQSHAPEGLPRKSAQSKPTELPGVMDVPEDANLMSARASMPVLKIAGKESPDKIALAKHTFLAQIAKLKKENVRLEEENSGLRADNARLVLERNTERANAAKLTSSWENEVAELVEAAKQFA